MKIIIEINQRQVINDVQVECNAVGRALQKTEGGAEIAAEVMTPEDRERYPIMARAMTEAFGEVKRICQTYLVFGKTSDDNRLEEIGRECRDEETIVAIQEGTAGLQKMRIGLLYRIEIDCFGSHVRILTNDGRILGEIDNFDEIEYVPYCDQESIVVENMNEGVAYVSVTYIYTEPERYLLEMDMPRTFNIGMTDTIKNCTHRMMVDYIMIALLNNLYPEKGREYAGRYEGDSEGLRNALRSRTMFQRRAEDWA